MHRPLRSAEERLLVAEVRRVHNQRVALPATERVSVPQADTGTDMRPSVERNDPAVVHRLIENRHVSRTLHNLRARIVPARPGDFTRDAALVRIVVQPRFGEDAVGLGLIPANLHDAEFLSLGRQGRKPPIRRIYDQRRACGGLGQLGGPEAVIRARVALSGRGILETILGGPLFERRGFFLREKRLLRLRLGAFHGRQSVEHPDSLQLRLAVRGPGRRRPRCRRGLGGRRRLRPSGVRLGHGLWRMASDNGY